MQRYPLHWPAGWPRTQLWQRKAAAFHKGTAGDKSKLTITDAIARLQRELDALSVGDMLLSTNLELRLDGHPRADRSPPTDTGVALYFRLKGKDTALACDKWDRVADNITALAKHIEALRGIDRWGVGSIGQAFAGYQALPAPEQWWQVLGTSQTASAAEIESAYRDIARSAHPDRGGSNAAMSRVNAARDAALSSLNQN
jgi:hypothetical protein